MNIITHWQALQALSHHNPFYQQLFQYIFQGIAQNNPKDNDYDEYWLESTLILLDSQEDKQLMTITDKQAFILHFPHDYRLHIEYLLDYPEYTESLGDTHYISLAIWSDEGSGIFLVFDKAFIKQSPLLNTLVQESYHEYHS